MPDVHPSGTLHGVIFAPFVRKVRAVLAAKAIAYQQVSVMPGAMDPTFLAKSPLSKIPVWEEPGFVLPDSSAICAYLERLVTTPSLYPAEPRAFATALFWEEYADTRMVDAAEPIFYERVVRPRVLRQAGDEEIVRRNLEEVVPPVFDQLESLYFAPGPFHAGVALPEAAGEAGLDISAIAIWSPIVNLEHVGVSVDAGQWPKLAAFMQAMNAHPVLRPIVMEERAALGIR